MPGQGEIDRCLVLIYASNNAHMWVNYTLCSERVAKLCKTEAAKHELVAVLRSLANDVAKMEAAR